MHWRRVARASLHCQPLWCDSRTTDGRAHWIGPNSLAHPRLDLTNTTVSPSLAMTSISPITACAV
jgi:hypothetical protein